MANKPKETPAEAADKAAADQATADAAAEQEAADQAEADEAAEEAAYTAAPPLIDPSTGEPYKSGEIPPGCNEPVP